MPVIGELCGNQESYMFRLTTECDEKFKYQRRLLSRLDTVMFRGTPCISGLMTEDNV